MIWKMRDIEIDEQEDGEDDDFEMNLLIVVGKNPRKNERNANQVKSSEELWLKGDKFDW